MARQQITGLSVADLSLVPGVDYPTPGGGGGSSATIYSGTIDVTGVRQSEFQGTITDANVSSTSKIILSHGAYTEDDENQDELEDILSIEPVNIINGSFDIRITAMGPIVGVFKFNYLIS